jgi:hypothetical protein
MSEKSVSFFQFYSLYGLNLRKGNRRLKTRNMGRKNITNTEILIQEITTSNTILHMRCMASKLTLYLCVCVGGRQDGVKTQDRIFISRCVELAGERITVI